MRILSRSLSGNAKIIVLRTKDKKSITTRIKTFSYIVSLGSKDVTTTVSTSLKTRLLKKRSIRRSLGEIN